MSVWITYWFWHLGAQRVIENGESFNMNGYTGFYVSWPSHFDPPRFLR